MKYQKPVNNINSNDEFSSGLIEKYGQWMDGDCFQNTEMPDLHEAPFDGMDAQSHGAEIEQTTKRKKGPTKKGAYVGQESKPKNEEVEVLEREEYEIDGQKYILEKIKGADGKSSYRKSKVECKDEVTHEGEELTEKKLDKVDKKELKGKHKDRDDKDIDNDGDVDGSDKFLHMRRKKVSKIISMKGKK